MTSYNYFRRCVHNWSTGSKSFILIALKLQFLGRKNLGGSFDLPLNVRGLNQFPIILLLPPKIFLLDYYLSLVPYSFLTYISKVVGILHCNSDQANKMLCICKTRSNSKPSVLTS